MKVGDKMLAFSLPIKSRSAARSRRQAHYGIPAARLLSGRPSSAGTHDASYNRFLNTTGLVSPWHFLTERFTTAGRWFLGATAIFFGYGSSSIDIQVYVPLIYAGALWIVAFLLHLLVRPRVTLQSRHADRVSTGTTLPVEVEVTANQLSRDLRVRPHRLPPHLHAVPPEGVALPNLRRGEKTRTTVQLRADRRGDYHWPGFRVESEFPFGLMIAARFARENNSLIVYPQFSPLARFELPTGQRYHPGGVALASARGESLEYIGNRDFREGDSIREIDWRATARLNQFIVREYRQEYFLRVAVILDTYVLGGPANEAEADNFERAVSLCAAVGDYMARQDYLVDILAAGPDLYHLTAGRSLAYLDQILDILACVESSEQEPFETLEPEILENLAQITTIICIFLDWTEKHRAFARRLSGQGAGLKAIIVREGACTIDPAEDIGWLGYVPVLSRQEFEQGIEEL